LQIISGDYLWASAKTMNFSADIKVDGIAKAAQQQDSFQTSGNTTK
jgi:hypothetical protein